MKKKQSNNLARILVVTVALIVLGVSGTYAYYTSTITGDAKQTELKAGNLDIDTNLESVSTINNTKLRLIDVSEKTTKAEKVSFYVKSTAESTVDAKYNIYLREISLTKNLYNSDFKWELLQNDRVVSSGTFANIARTDAATEGEAFNAATTAEDIRLNTEELTLTKDNRNGDTLTFRVWLENNEIVNQIELTNGNFSGKLYLEAYPVSEQK